MAALPAGFVDTGLTESWSAAGTVAVNAWLTNEAHFNDWSIRLEFNVGPFVSEVRLYIPGESHTVLGTFTEGSGLLGPFAFSDSAGPYRLGVRHQQLDAGSGGPVVEYRLFADENTIRTTSFAGVERSAALVAPGGTPVLQPAVLGAFQFGGRSNQGMDRLACRFTGLSLNGTALDTTNLPLPFAPTGSGAADLPEFNLGFEIVAASAAEPFVFTLDATMTGHDGAPLEGPLVFGHATAGGFKVAVTPPHNEEYILANDSWDRNVPGATPTEAFFASAGSGPGWWLGTITPVDGINGTALPMRTNPPAVHPHTTPVYYQPIEATFAAELDVIPSANEWEADDPAKIDVSGTGGNVWDVIDTAGEVSRTWKENWRAWVGLDTGGKGHTDFAVDRYDITRHDYLTGGDNNGQDVWHWGSYGWMELQINAPASGSITMVVEGVHIAVTDTHELGDPTQRAADLSVTEHAFTYTYLVPLASGANTKWIDLLFPEESGDPGPPGFDVNGPLYYGRVDTVTFSSFAAGEYTLTSMKLKAREDGYLYLGSSLQWAIDGCFGIGDIPDTLLKGDATGEFGGAIFPFVVRRDRSGFGTLLSPFAVDRTLADMWEALNRVEGWSVTFDQGLEDANLEDGDGNSLGPSYGDWNPRVIPEERITPDVPFSPEIHVTCLRMAIPNMRRQGSGLPAFRYPLDYIHERGRIEALLSTETGTRAAAGVEVRAMDVGTSQELDAADTDESGYVAISLAAEHTGKRVRLESG